MSFGVGANVASVLELAVEVAAPTRSVLDRSCGFASPTLTSFYQALILKLSKG